MCVTAHTHTYTHTFTHTHIHTHSQTQVREMPEGRNTKRRTRRGGSEWGLHLGGHEGALGVREAVVAAKRRMVGEIFMSRKRGEASLKTALTLSPHPSNPLTQSLLLSRVLTEPIVTSLRDILLLL